MILADKIMNLRKKAGWSQDELASQLNVTRQSVSKWEGAQSVPDIDRIVQMSRLFGVTTDYLLKDEIENEELGSSEPESALRRVTMDKLLEEGDYTREKKKKSPVFAAVSTAYWLIVTAIFLYCTFGPNGNGQPGTLWYIWAVAGVLYGAIAAFRGVILRSGKR